MPAKVKQIKDDVIINIKVNKTFYMMAKSLSIFLVQNMNIEDPDVLKGIMDKDFDKLNETEKCFYTVALLLAEIEFQANEQGHLEEKEVLLPGDEGYIAPEETSKD